MVFLVICGIVFLCFRLKRNGIRKAKPASNHNASPKLQSSPSVHTRRSSNITCETTPGTGSLERNRCQQSRSLLSKTRPSADAIPPVNQFQETFLHSRSGKVALLRLACSEAERQSTVTTEEGVKGHGAQVKRISCEFHRHASRYDMLRLEDLNESLIYESLRNSKTLPGSNQPNVD